MMTAIVELAISQDHVATLTLNRPDAHNALNHALIGELTRQLKAVETNHAVRLLLLNARGNFCAGADIASMKAAGEATEEDNLKDAEHLATLMHTLHTFSKPVIALLQGSVYGGGLGLVACSDIAIAADNTVFCLSEVKLGLIPAVISPYVVEAIGARNARRYFQTAERFGAMEAMRIGLIHEVVTPAELEAVSQHFVRSLLDGAPAAQVKAKALIQAVSGKEINADLMAFTTKSIAKCRSTDEAREGLSAFLEKRLPSWRTKNL